MHNLSRAMHIVTMADESKTRTEPMTVTEITELFRSAVDGYELSVPDVRRIFATLVAWAPGNPWVTPNQQAALDRYDALLEKKNADGYIDIDSDEATDTMSALADSLRPQHAAIEELFAGCQDRFELGAALIVVVRDGNASPTLIRKLHTKQCERNGWEPS